MLKKIVAMNDRPRILPPTADLPLLRVLENGFRREGPTVLVVVDGFGIGTGNPKEDAIAAYLEQNPDANWSRLLRSEQALYTRLAAHGPAVGLPGKDDMGNSEVGHNAIGAGRIPSQGAKIIKELIEAGDFYTLPRLTELIDNVLEHDSTLHLMGLLQTSGVHAHIDHVKALVEAADRRGIKRIRIHALTDGRDDTPESSIPLMQDLLEFLQSFDSKGRDYKVASGGGRMWMTMDRYESSWEMVHRGWETHVHGNAELKVRNALQGIETGRTMSHTSNPLEIDQFLPSYVVVDEDGRPIGRIQDNDSVVFWNYRGDRAMEISQAFEEGEAFTHFDRGYRPRVQYAGMMLYDGDKGIPNSYLVQMPRITLTMGEIIAHNGGIIIAGAEAQKYGHITYFTNGNFSGPFDPSREQYVRVSSDDPSLFATLPQMKAKEVTDRILEAYQLKPGTRFIRINYANTDMVGHTGIFNSAVQAVAAVDRQIGRLMEFVTRTKGILIVTADHGNADEMVKKGKPSNSHSINPVPFVVFDPSFRRGDYELDPAVSKPTLGNIAPTLFNLAGYVSPTHMDRTLIRFGR